MKGAKMKGWALVGALALVGTMATSALAIEAFQERFEWGDLSKPTTLRGRVAVADPYDKAVWINVAVFWLVHTANHGKVSGQRQSPYGSNDQGCSRFSGHGSPSEWAYGHEF